MRFVRLSPYCPGRGPRSFLAVAIFVLLGVGGRALGEEAAGDPGEPSGRAAAMELYRTAEVRYRAGRFEEAVALLRRAIEIEEIPALHHNLGRALQELGRWQEARQEYLTYLEQDPGSEARARIEARIAALDRLISERRDAETPEDDEGTERDGDVADRGPGRAPDPAPGGGDPRRVLPWPWAIAGLGCAALATAAVLAALFADDAATARDPTTAQLHAVEARDRAEAYGLAATTLFVMGGVVAAGGLLWGLLDLLLPRRQGRERLAVRLGPLGLTLSGAVP